MYKQISLSESMIHVDHGFLSSGADQKSMTSKNWKPLTFGMLLKNEALHVHVHVGHTYSKRITLGCCKKTHIRTFHKAYSLVDEDSSLFQLKSYVN